MAGLHRTPWEEFERWSPKLFLVAGVLFVGHMAVRGIEAFTTMPTPVDVFGPAGYVAAILGLFGVYPTLADRTPSLSRIAAFLATVTAPAWALISGWNVGEAAGILPPQTDVVPAQFFFVVIVSTLLMYLLFGFASLRAGGVHTRAFGLLLMMPGGLFILLIVGSVTLPVNAAVGGVIIGGGQAIVHGSIGGMLLTGRTRTDHVDPSTDLSVD